MPDLVVDGPSAAMRVAVQQMPALVPGVRVKGDSVLSCPWHAVWLTVAWLRFWDCKCTAVNNAIGNAPPARGMPLAKHFALVAAGWNPYEVSNETIAMALEHYRKANELHPWVDADYLTTYQKKAAVYAATRDALFLNWAPGAGKTLGALLFLLSRQSARIVVTRAAARGTWERQVKQYTTVEPYVLRPASERRKKDGDLREYLDKFKGPNAQGWPIVIVGYESLSNLLGEIAAQPEFKRLYAVAFDESHRYKHWKRWQVTPEADGSVSFDLATTGAGKLKIAAAVHLLSKQATAGRVALTATPIPNKPRDIWAQLDLIEPYQWGSWTNFSRRYCGARQSDFGWVTNSESNTDELVARLRWVMHRVSYRESHGELPAKRRAVVRLDPSQQVKETGGWKRAMAAAKKRGKGAELELGLMKAASRKRKYSVERAIEVLETGGKVLLLTGRIADAEITAEQIRNALGRKGIDIPVLEIHGGSESNDVDEAVDGYMSATGGACLVGTIDRAGESLNLQDTDLLLMAMLPWTWGQFWQAENRVSRLGQKRPVLVECVVALGTVDEGVALKFLDKLSPIGKLTEDEEIDGLADELVGMNSEEMAQSIFNKLDTDMGD